MEKTLTQKVLRPYIPIFQTDARYIILMGGRGAGRSYVASQYALTQLNSADYNRTAIMRYVLGDIRNSIFQEILDRIDENGVQNSFDIGENMLEIQRKETPNIVKGIGFRKSSGDQKSKLKSLASFNNIIIEEADEVAEEDFMQLDDSLRTIKSDIKIILLLNTPDKNHWIVKRWFNLIPSEIDGFYIPTLKDSEKHNTLFIHTEYLNNQRNLNQSTLDNYLRYKETRPDYYWNMIKGLVSSGVRGRIFKDWQPISVKEYEALDYPTFWGCDFGFTNDPTAIVEIKQHNDNIYVRELLYQTGLINKKVSERMEQLGISKMKEIYCDSAEPKSVEELRTYGWNAIPSEKGAGSRKAGVDLLLGKKVFYTEDSSNIAKEMQGYCWALDKNKEPTNEPQDGNDHCCFTKDTIITNPFGEIIETYYTGEKDVYEFMGSRVTAEHPYLTQRGFVRLDTLSSFDRIVIWKNKLLMELALDDTQTLTGVSFGAILHLLQRNVLAIRLNVSTGIFGKKIMERYLKAFIFTIRTVIHLIMIYLISNCYQFVNTLWRAMIKCYQGGKRIWREQSDLPQNGVEPQKGKSLGLNWGRKTLTLCIIIELIRIVFGVVKNMWQKTQTPNFAQRPASIKNSGKERVYATKTNNGFFFANNVLVSNCDAIRMAVFTKSKQKYIGF